MKRRVALITGGTRGIGGGISVCLSNDGYDLVLCGRRKASEVAEFLDALRGRGSNVCYLEGDISNTSDRERMLVEAKGAFGRLDLLVNNAGVAPQQRADILHASEESFDRLIGINLRGPYFLTQAVANWMIEQQAVSREPRAIITIGSVSAELASVNRGDYCISKAGLSMAARLWAVRLAEHGISVYELRPGIIETDMTRSVKAKYDELIEDGLLLEKRWGTPTDVGRAVTALARGEVPYATGSIISIDGGLTVPRL